MYMADSNDNPHRINNIKERIVKIKMKRKLKCPKMVMLLLAAVMSVFVGGCSKAEPLSEDAIGGAESVVYAVDPFVIGLAAVVVLAAIVIIAILVAKNKKR